MHLPLETGGKYTGFFSHARVVSFLAGAATIWRNQRVRSTAPPTNPPASPISSQNPLQARSSGVSRIASDSGVSLIASRPGVSHIASKSGVSLIATSSGVSRIATFSAGQ